MYGGYPVYVAGMIWLTIWSLIAGFSTNEIMLNFCRAFQGLGPAAFLPSSIMILGSVYRPGPRKNLVFSIYGCSAVAGSRLRLSLFQIVPRTKLKALFPL
jgi:MFS family permease